MLENVENYDNIITYQRKLKKMENTQNQGQEASSQVTQNSSGTSRINAEKILTWLGIIGGLFAVVAAIYAIIENVIVPISDHTKEIEHIEEDIAKINNDLGKIDEINNNLNEFIYTTNALLKDNNYNEKAIAVRFIDDYRPKLIWSNDEEILAEPKLTENRETVATGLHDSNIAYTAEDLQNKLIVTMYKESGYEIYFLGTYNENNHWNGECILNAYWNNELVSVFSGIYNDGELYSYKRVSCDQSEGWTVAKRTNYDTYASGETWNYEKSKSFPKKIDSEKLDESQIWTVDEFLNNLGERLTGYYKGNTSEGTYNDNTGDAYIVRYNESGNVRYLYKGKIVNGEEFDDTGDALIISWGYANDGYHSYKGEFIGNDDYKSTKEFLKTMTQDEINEKINPEDFDCPLTGLIDSDS